MKGQLITGPDGAVGPPLVGTLDGSAVVSCRGHLVEGLWVDLVVVCSSSTAGSDGGRDFPV